MLEIGSYVEGKYKVLNKIGQGGMSVVYLVMNEKANKQWAIKEIRKDGVRDFEAVCQGLVVETELLKKLDHPNLPSIVDVIDEDDTMLIVMDYIQGNPLSKALEEYGAQPQELVIEWAKQLCDVLGYLHTCDPPVIYRDMKPANVMLKPDGNLTLIDFGTAREFKERNLADTVCLGTIGYAAPEQFGGLGQTDARTDVYCLGATLYHLVTGQNPCEPPYDIRPIREINPALSGGLEKIILKCTQRNPEDRYQSCAEMMYALEHYEEIDDLYLKKQRRRLGVFIATVFLCFVFAGISIFGYVSAENKKSENYTIKLAEASDVQLNAQERAGLYLEAIEIDPSAIKAYLDMIELFLASSEEGGSLSIEEASIFTKLRAGLDVRSDKGYTTTMYPLDILKKKNISGYEEVCYEIGMAYWYDYTIQDDRYSVAAEWFKGAVNHYPIAQVLCDIGETQQQIKKFAGQARTEDMYNAYEELWEKVSSLKEAASASEDRDTKVLVWKEIINTISDKAAYFSVHVNTDDMVMLLDSIRSEAKDMREIVKLEDIKSILDKVLEDIDTAKERINATIASKEKGTKI